MIATTFQRLYPCFRGRATRRDWWKCSPTSGYVGNQRWRPLTGSSSEITYISARMHDSNEIPTATLMFSRRGNTERLVGMLSDVWVCRSSVLVAIDWKLIGNNVYLDRVQQCCSTVLLGTCTSVVLEYKFQVLILVLGSNVLVLGPWVLAFMERVQVLSYRFSFRCLLTYGKSYIDGIVRINATRFCFTFLSALYL